MTFYDAGFTTKSLILIPLIMQVSTKLSFWVFVEEEDPYLNYEELENAIYEEGAYPASVGPSSNIEGSLYVNNLITYSDFSFIFFKLV